LTQGCYHAYVSADYGSGRITFWVVPGGTIREVTNAERDSMNAISTLRARAQVHDAASAIAKCKRGYSSAQTAQDSMQVDRAVWTDTLRLGNYSCGWFRQYYRTNFEGNR
jgi:predicted secreted protein